MKIYYLSKDALSDAAKAHVEFDMGSIRQVVAADRGDEPDVWLVAQHGYQTKGHPLRDSDSIRLLAYSKNSHVVYGTDGCNTCRHFLNTSLETIVDRELTAISERTQLPQTLLGHLARIIRS